MPYTEYLPASHSVHAAEPVTAEYLPESHSVHAPEPEMLLYVPATQAVHVSRLLVYPIMHLHMEMSELPASDREFKGHAWHVVSLVAPKDEEYLFSGHGMHEMLPVEG